MGIVFVILIHLVAIFLISTFFALVSIILTRVLSKVENRKRKMFFAGIAPYVGLYSFYIFGLFGAILVSEIKNVDIGIGDCWYVPIKGNCKLTFIDLEEQSYLDDDNKTLIESVAYIQLTEDKLFGKTYDSLYFSYNMTTKDFQKYKNELELLKANDSPKLNLNKAMDFYIERRNEIAGIYFTIVGVISALTSIIILWILRKLIFKTTERYD